MTRMEFMRAEGAKHGALHRRLGKPCPSVDVLTAWAEHTRVTETCRTCPNDDACAEWLNLTACPATLRREYKRAYRMAYAEDLAWTPTPKGATDERLRSVQDDRQR